MVNYYTVPDTDTHSYVSRRRFVHTTSKTGDIQSTTVTTKPTCKDVKELHLSSPFISWRKPCPTRNWDNWTSIDNTDNRIHPWVVYKRLLSFLPSSVLFTSLPGYYTGVGPVLHVFLTSRNRTQEVFEPPQTIRNIILYDYIWYN